MAQTVLITGTSTGFGKLIAKDFYAKGWNVVATMRNPDRDGADLKALGDRILVTALDVQKQDTIDAAVKQALAKFGKIDVLVNNAGIAAMGVFEGTDDALVQKQYDINVFGPMRVTNAVLPSMRANKKGTVVIVSSIMGGMSSPLVALYASSKWAIEGWAECIQYELMPFNIQMKLVQPGAYKTEIQGRAMDIFTKGPEDEPIYAAAAGGMEAMFKNMEFPDPNPEVPDAVYAAATEGNATKLRYPVYPASQAEGWGGIYDARQKQGYEANYQGILAMQAAQAAAAAAAQAEKK